VTDRYAVIGNPIAHSKSPLIHAAFARQTGETISYDRILGTVEDFVGQVTSFFADGGCGMNVTVPFKEDAWKLADEHNPRATAAEAANTLILLENGRLLGDNTDGVGLVRDLEQNHGLVLKGRRILLLGAGGAARGVTQTLIATGPAALVIANRTAARAVELAGRFSAQGPVQGVGLDALAGERFDLVINATAAGLGGEVPRIPDQLLSPDGWCYDMMYGDSPTAFVRWGIEHGAVRSLDGLGMLVEQAAESYFLWRGVRPKTDMVIADLRSGRLH